MNYSGVDVSWPVRALAALFVVCLAPAGSYAQDVRNSSDHPLFPDRMPGYTISNYEQQAFSSYKFRTRPPQEVDGKYTRIHYYLKDTSQHPGGLAIRRNYENAIKSIGGEVVHSDENVSVMKAMHGGAEVFAEVVKLLSQHGSLRVGVEGHTDNTGAPAANKTLSEARASSVVNALVAAGVKRDRLEPAGFGQERPIADNRTEEGRAKNRRVEIVKR